MKMGKSGREGARVMVSAKNHIFEMKIRIKYTTQQRQQWIFEMQWEKQTEKKVSDLLNISE